MVSVELEGVSKRYGATTALEALSLTVADGEFFTLVGPSGCGKTTTLRLLAGFEEPTEGTIRFDGEQVGDVAPERRGVGLVFQNYALFPHMTVGENIAYGLNFADPPDGVSKHERVGNLLELVDLPGMADRDPTELSGGQRQRVALARALAPGPELLLLDEPMSALDARLRERLRRAIASIQSELDVTTIYVTHDQAEALAVSDRLAVLSAGHVEQIGAPQTVYRRPKSRFVADFVGENNVFDGTVAETEPRSTSTETTVQVGEQTFAIAAADIAGGVTFCVRPGAFDPEEDRNRITGRVLDSEFLGETTRVRLAWADRRLVVSLPDPPEREMLTVGFDPDDAWVLG
jgi:thiamine transport system ATP-binding protein